MLLTRKRLDALELLDRSEILPEELERSLTDLERSNRWLGGVGALMPHLLPLIGQCRSFLDVGCGGGDMLRLLADEGKRRMLRLDLIGLDASRQVIFSARRRCLEHPDIRLLAGDAGALPFRDGSVDVVFSSTFAHHLDPPVLTRALAEAGRVARRRVVVVDLVRSDLGWFAAWLVGKAAFGRLSRSDGPLSFRRAYRPEELREIAQRAGLVDARLCGHGPLRMALVWESNAHFLEEDAARAQRWR